MEDRALRAERRTEYIAQPLPGQSQTRYGLTSLVGFLGFHIVLAGSIQVGPVVATTHALSIIALAAWAALRWNNVGIACVAAYVAGADVLWRMTGADVPWEISKYLIAALCFAGIFRMGRRAQWNGAALVYFLALLPSIAVLLQGRNLRVSHLMQLLSFNLSGPLCLFASAWFMSQVRLDRRDVRLLLASFVGPTLTIAVVTLIATHSATDLAFSNESSFATSGGFGPNQVSASLGLGALCTLLFAIEPGLNSGQRWAALALVLFFGTQSALTFSRGGLYNFAIAFVLASLVFWRDRSSRKWLMRLAIVGSVIAASFVFPRLETFTGGELKTRFEDTDPGRRTTIIREDFRLWDENPGLGLGPGGARDQRRGESTISHTEYSRMLSEHGLFGVAALLALGTMCWIALTRQQSHRERALRIAFFAWSFASMSHIGMRIAAVGLTFGWGCARSLFSEHTHPSSN